MRRRIAVTVALALGVSAALVVWGIEAARMPGVSFEGPPPPPSPEERRLSARLAADVRTLAIEIGERNERRYGALVMARDFIERRFRAAGLEPRRHTYEIVRLSFDNVVVELGPPRAPVWMIGAHYDSAPGSPGGNDDASGVAVLLALADRLAHAELTHRVRLVAFVNEEPPHFGRPTMGSRVYADALAAAGELPDAMIALDSVGRYDARPGTQRYASPVHSLRFGDAGDYVALIGDDLSEDWLRRVVARFRDGARIRSEGAVVSRSMLGATWSDHASFWRHDVPAILITDTAAFRDPHYHRASDDGSQIDAIALARVTLGLERVLRGP